MNYKDINSLKEVCGILSEKYLLDIVEENNKLKNKINELISYKKPKIKDLFLNNDKDNNNNDKDNNKDNNNDNTIGNKEYNNWCKNFYNDICVLVDKFVNDYHLMKIDNDPEFKELFYDTSYCDIIDCFIYYFTVLTGNKYWATRISDTYLTSIGFFLNENTNLENDKENFKTCIILALNNIISHIISFELEE